MMQPFNCIPISLLSLGSNGPVFMDFISNYVHQHKSATYISPGKASDGQFAKQAKRKGNQAKRKGKQAKRNGKERNGCSLLLWR